MSPTPPCDDGPYGALLHAEDFCELSVSLACLDAPRSHLFCELKAQLRAVPAIQVLAMRDGLKMVWVHASRNTTKVIKIRSGRHRPFGSSKRFAMSEATRLDSVAVRKDAVAVTIVRAQEDPARSSVSAVANFPEMRSPVKSFPNTGRMTSDEPERLAFHPSMPGVIPRHQPCRLATSTLAELWRIVVSYVGLLNRLASRGVSRNAHASRSYSLGLLS